MHVNFDVSGASWWEHADETGTKSSKCQARQRPKSVPHAMYCLLHTVWRGTGCLPPCVVLGMRRARQGRRAKLRVQVTSSMRLSSKQAVGDVGGMQGDGVCDGQKQRQSQSLHRKEARQSKHQRLQLTDNGGQRSLVCLSRMYLEKVAGAVIVYRGRAGRRASPVMGVSRPVAEGARRAGGKL